MSEQHETPLATYLESLGGPDTAATDRLARSMEQAIGRSERPAVPRWVWAAAAAVVLGGPVTYLLLQRGPVDEAPTVATMETARAAQELRLSHAGRATLAAETRVQVLRNDRAGARLRLLAGTVTLDVNHVDGASWLVESEGYLVTAVGTIFTVEHRRGQVPGVEVAEGVVRITGPGLPDGGVDVAAPSRPEEVAGVDTAGESVPGRVPAPVDEPEEEPVEAAAEAPAPVSDKPDVLPWVGRFRRAIQEGRLAEAAAALPERFPRGRLTGLGAADVLDAGDALRASGQVDRALETYRSVCERWSRSSSCGVATLREALLQARRGNRSAAIEGATRYLEREPRGALARDALGRRMQWRNEVGDRAGARADARTYIERWPNGSLAATARKMLDE